MSASLISIHSGKCAGTCDTPSSVFGRLFAHRIGAVKSVIRAIVGVILFTAFSAAANATPCDDMLAKLQDGQPAHATDVTNYIFNCPKFTGNISVSAGGGATGGELVDAWTNGPTYPYETLTTSGSSIISAVNTAGYGFAYKAVNTYAGHRYRVTFTLTLNSGPAPTFFVDDDGYGDGPNYYAYSQSGANTFEWTASANKTYVDFETTNGALSNYSISNFSMTEVISGGSGNVSVSGLITGGGANGIKVTSDGNVGIGTTSPQVALDIVGSGHATGGFSTTSDLRDKQQVAPLSFAALNAVERLRPVTFFWKSPKDDGMKGRQTGLIAQEVENVLPSTILTANDARKSKAIKYDELTAILIKAIQEQQKLDRNQRALLQTQGVAIKELRAQINNLQVRNAKLEERLGRVEPKRSARAN